MFPNPKPHTTPRGEGNFNFLNSSNQNHHRSKRKRPAKGWGEGGGPAAPGSYRPRNSVKLTWKVLKEVICTGSVSLAERILRRMLRHCLPSMAGFEVMDGHARGSEWSQALSILHDMLLRTPLSAMGSSVKLALVP